jgi:PAS domain S-box-containing protein
MKIGAREAFLQKIPFLMLLFGITLTLIGTMYVRNNQRQSVKLSAMNKELAHKNYELSQQMSERERLNQVIQKSARDNSAVINAVSDVIFELSVDEKIVFLNSTWKKVTGFDLEQSIGRNLFDLLYYQDQEEQKENFYQLVKGQKKPYRVYTRLRTSDGTFRSVELTMSMLRQDENKDLRVVGTITDVEERRRAERALSEAEKKYRAIVENAAAGIYQVTPEGQYLSANPALAKILGYDRPEDILRDITNVTQEIYVDQGAREKVLREVVSSKMPKTIELRIKRKDGTIAWANENIRPVYDDEGNLIFYEGSMEDIDQRKNAELALREAKIESDLANRAKSEFLANMSHELRTPLNSIIGFSDIIKGQAFGEIAEPKYLEYAENINGSGNSLLKVINEILDVSRIDAGERTLNETHINVSELVSSTLMMLNRKLKAANMEVHNHITDPALGLIGEAQAIKQILVNLLSNAMKFSKGSGVITLESEINSKGGLRLSITDTGVGLTESEIEKALSPFGQIETELSRDKSGTGLGLTLVKSLMRLHGGQLELVSQKGVGTTATLIFPEKRVTKVTKKENDAVVEKAQLSRQDSLVERMKDE